MEGDTCYDNDAGRRYAVRVEVRLCTRTGSALRSRGAAPREPTAAGVEVMAAALRGNECPADRDVRVKLRV